MLEDKPKGLFFPASTEEGSFNDRSFLCTREVLPSTVKPLSRYLPALPLVMHTYSFSFPTYSLVLSLLPLEHWNHACRTERFFGNLSLQLPGSPFSCSLVQQWRRPSLPGRSPSPTILSSRIRGGGGGRGEGRWRKGRTRWPWPSSCSCYQRRRRPSPPGALSLHLSAICFPLQNQLPSP